MFEQPNQLVVLYSNAGKLFTKIDDKSETKKSRLEARIKKLLDLPASFDTNKRKLKMVVSVVIDKAEYIGSDFYKRDELQTLYGVVYEFCTHLCLVVIGTGINDAMAHLGSRSDVFKYRALF